MTIISCNNRQQKVNGSDTSVAAKPATFTFRYYGGQKDWDTAKTSEIFICWAYDELGKGGSEGTGGVNGKTLKYLTTVFEKELVHNIDKKLNLSHIESE